MKMRVRARAKAIFCSNVVLLARTTSSLSGSFPKVRRRVMPRGVMAVVGCPIRLGAGAPWAEASQSEVAQCEMRSSSSAPTSAARSFGPEFEIFERATVQGQSGGRTRDRPLKSAEAGTGIASDVRLPRTCRGRSEARVGEGLGSVPKPPVDVEVEQCSKFIARAGQMVAELDAEHAAEFGALQASRILQCRCARLQIVPRSWH